MWEIRVYFLQEPPQYDVRFRLKRIPAKTLKAILGLSAMHRAELFEEWERSQSG